MAFGHGKVILLGEHAVVYGKPALAAAIDLGIYAQAVVSDQDALSIDPWNVSIQSSDSSKDPLVEAFKKVLEYFSFERPFLAVKVQCGLPAGAGLGCSAALGVAITLALNEALQNRYDFEKCAQIAHAWECVFHGQPSGIDTTLSLYGDTILYARNEPRVIVNVSRTVTLVICHSGESSLTKNMVHQVACLREQSFHEFDQILDEIESIVIEGHKAIEQGDLTTLGRLFDMNQNLLSSLHVSTPKLDELCHIARQHGALGAKLTGAGGGGCMIALCEDVASSESIMNALREYGNEPFVVELVS